MKLQSKILLIIIPFVLLSLLALAFWSFSEAKTTTYSSNYRYLSVVLESYVDESIYPNYQLLIEAKMDKILSYVESYKQDAINKADAISKNRGGHFIIINGTGELIYCSKGFESKQIEPLWFEVSKSLVSENSDEIKKGYIKKDPYNDIYVASYFNPWDWVVFYSIPDKNISLLVNRIRLITLGVALLCALVGSILIFTFCKLFLVDPIAKLKKAADKIADQKNVRTIIVHSKDELGRLARSMELMSKSIYQNKNELKENEKKLIKKHEELQKSQLELKQYKDSLEILVDERTSELSDSEERFQNAMEATKDGLYDWDLKTNKIYYSPGWKRMLGYQDDELPNDFSIWEQLTEPEDVKRSWEMQQEVINKKRDRFELEFKMRHKAGHWVNILSRAKAVFDENEKAVKIVGTHVDITPQKNIETKLLASEKKLLEKEKALHLSLDAANAGTWTWDILSNEVIWDEQMQRIFGIEPGTFKGTFDAWRERLHPDDLAGAEKETIASMEQGKRYEHEYRVKSFSGEWRIINAQAATLMDNKGNPVRMSGFAMDVTERRQVERTLQEKHLQLQAVLDHSPALISIKDLEGTVILANRNFELLDIPPLEEFIGKNIFELFPKEVAKDLWKNDLDALETAGPIEVEEIVAHKDGSLHTYLTIKFPLFYENKKPFGICAISTDITERKKLEAKLIQAQKMESIGQLAGGIAHDFNNILYPILGFTQMVMDDLPKTHQVQEDLKDILDGAKRARDLVKRILLFSRQKEQVLEPTKLKPLIEETLKLLRSSIPANINIQQELYDGEDYVLCDSSEIHEIVMNLCTNAYQAIEGKDGTIQVGLSKINPDPDLKLPPSDYICLSVSDSGAGIPSTQIDKIFEPYFTTKEIGKGTGLGLSVVHGIVRNYKGDIQVTSSPEEGTVFNVILPVTHKLDDDIQEQSQKLLGGNERILFVDDEESIMKLGVRVLEKNGYSVIGTQLPLEALSIFNSGPEKFDLVISDMAMPKMIGSKLAKKILETRPDIPIIICSGYSEKLDTLEAENLNVKAFIDKPILIEELTAKVREVLDQI